MTNHWIDIKNADVILIMGSNAAENHPISFNWVTKAIERGATLISVDPRFTRTSARAHIYAPLRAGTDIAFLGGMIKYILDNELYNEEYIKLYTNATFLVDPNFKLPGENGGVFSGYDPKKRSYDKTTWKYQLDENGVPKRDLSLKDPNCVFQLLKKHYSRYDLDTVSKITGTPKDLLEKVYRTFGSTGEKGKAGTIMYAMGWTQHTVGTQIIRTMCIIQLLLGNIGVSGGGVNALRGESNVQGSTDHAILFHILPGYLKTPKASQQTLEEYNKKNAPKSNDPMSANWWKNYPKYIASLLRAFYKDDVPLEEAYSYLPKLDDGENYSWLLMFDRMDKGKIKGFFAWGQNPACSSANAGKVRRALSKLDWMVAVNVFDNETASFWKGPGMDPKKIKTEVFLLPAAMSFEKEGSITNSGRWMQWRYKAVDPPGEAKPDSEIMNLLYKEIRRLYEKEGGVFPDPILNLRWDYGEEKVDIDKVAREVNGFFIRDKVVKGRLFRKGEQVPSFVYLQDDGSTCSGNWLYCGSYTEAGNMAKRRDKEYDPFGTGLYPRFAWCWPVNRRILYNRASVDENGKPWDPEHPVIVWKHGKWIGDVPDGGWPPLSYGEKSKWAFIMLPEGFARVFSPVMKDGPFPEHYEPLESPLKGNIMNPQRVNPCLRMISKPGVGKGEAVYATNDPRFPYVATTYRLTEHWQTGVLTRWNPWLLELQPQLFVELDPILAQKKGIKSGDRVKVISARGEVIGVAIVTNRFQPLKVDGKVIHQIGLPWCFGWLTPKNGGDSANLLTPFIGDPNTMIPETKVFMANIEKV